VNIHWNINLIYFQMHRKCKSLCVQRRHIKKRSISS